MTLRKITKTLARSAMHLYKLSFFCIVAVFSTVSCKDGGPSTPEVHSFHGKIYSFKLESGQIGEALIDQENRLVQIDVLAGKDLTQVTPTIEITPSATISPASGETVNFAEQNGERIYVVTAESGQEYEWKVVVEEVGEPVSAEMPDYGTHAIRNMSESTFLTIEGDMLYNEKYDDGATIGLGAISSGDLNDTDRWNKWHAIYEMSENDKEYYKLRNLHSGKLLTVSDNSETDEGTRVVQQSELENNIDPQLWELQDAGLNGLYKIIDKQSGLALGIENSSGSVMLQTPANVSGQEWYFNPLDPDSYRDDEVLNFFNRNEEYMGSVAFDQGNSIPLSWGPNEGKVLWITQDAWDGEQLNSNDKFSCGHFFRYNNSVMVQPSKDNWDPEDTPNLETTNSTEDMPRQVFNVQSGQDWTWPGVGVEIGDKVYVHAGEGTDLDANTQAIYVLTQNSGLQWDVQRTTPDGMTDSEEINYSTGMVDGGDGYIYSFGSDAGAFGYSSALHVARFPKDNPQQWEFWDGSSWGPEPVTGDQVKIADGLATNSVAYVNGKYVYLTMQNGFNCDDDRGKIYMSTSTKIGRAHV